MRTLLLLRRELRDSVRGYWFAVNSAIFVLGGMALMLFGQGDVQVLGYRGVARALAALMQLALLVVPLMAIFPSVAAVAGERELGTLDYLLAQPITRRELYGAKWLGIGAAVGLSITLGYSVTGATAALRGVPSGMILALLGFSLLLAMVFVSSGLWVSALSGSRAQATALGLTLWLSLLALGSLGLMAAFVRWGLPQWLLEAWSLVNPTEAFRIAMIAALNPESAILGPAGASLVGRLGRPLLLALAAASMLGWSAVAYWGGLRSFSRRI
ncbi:MAG: ABC transporter permease [Gemmatimonadota bacterium]